MYGLPDTLRPLSAAEERVMLAVWACPGAAARRDISQKLKATGWAAATVLNFLYRLEEKGWVRSAKQGNCNVYVPLVTRRAYGVYCMRQRLDTLFGRRPCRRRPCAGKRERLLPERLGAGHPGVGGEASGDRGVRFVRPLRLNCFIFFYKMLVDSEISVL